MVDQQDLQSRLDTIHTKAEAATPGPWQARNKCSETDGTWSYDVLMGEDYETGLSMVGWARHIRNSPVGKRGAVQQAANTEYIAAADPAVVMALVDIAKELPEIIDLMHEDERVGMANHLYVLRDELERALRVSNGVA